MIYNEDLNNGSISQKKRKKERIMELLVDLDRCLE